MELTCIYCGFVLDVQKPKTESRPVQSPCVFVVDDSQFTRELLEGALIQKGLAQTVILAENGQEFITAFNKRLAQNLPVGMVILDIEMPVMDGITAAKMMRSVENIYQSARIPILFFSARKCDEDLKQQLSAFAPASYINKGASGDPANLFARLDQLVTLLLQKRQSPPPDKPGSP
jgi:CheY-like chemotaxis protein